MDDNYISSDPGIISDAIQLHNAHHQHKHQGQLQVIFGPMFSGKTTELIRRCRRFVLANYSCVIVKYANDTRYSIDEVETHDRTSLPAIPAVSLNSIRKQLLNYEVIAIDEGQFFPDTVAISEELANLGKVVIVAALDGDYKRESFGNILELVPRAESVIKLTAICMNCSHSASYTKRTSDDTAQEVIGGADKYIAVCRRCHLTSADSIKSNNRDASAQTTKLDIRSNNTIRNIRPSPTKKFVNAN